LNVCRSKFKELYSQRVAQIAAEGRQRAEEAGGQLGTMILTFLRGWHQKTQQFMSSLNPYKKIHETSCKKVGGQTRFDSIIVVLKKFSTVC